MNRVAAAILLGLAPALGLITQSCDRCTGVIGCTGAPRLSLDGQLIVRATGAGVPGATLDFIRTGGAQLTSDSTRTTTNAEGWFNLAVDAAASGLVTGDLVVRPPSPAPAYRVLGLSFPTSDVRGEGQVLGSLVTTPYIEFIGEVHSVVAGAPVAGAQVTVQRTGGVAIAPPDTFTVTSDSLGRIYFKVNAAEPGTMIADLSITTPAQQSTTHISSVNFAAHYLDVIPQVAGVFLAGAWTPYVGELYRRGSMVRSAGISVEFERTGGVAASPDTFTVQTNDAGRFPLITTPLAVGNLVGNLIVRPPAPELPETIFAVTMPPLDTNQLVLIGIWSYGYALNYAGELFYQHTGLLADSVAVEFRRTGGLAISPDTFTAQTNSVGRFAIEATAPGPGQVVAELIVHLPSPQAPDTITGVVITTFASDQMRFLGRWAIGPP